MILSYTFPFGMPVQTVSQQDRMPKKVFVLGVYASAVHARWCDPHGQTKVTALAVASEPYIFWRGDGAAAIIDQITIPPVVGTLAPAAKQFNGPSGRALDERFLHPLQVDRHDAWLCDLVPYSCQNSQQQQAILRAYQPLMSTFQLPAVTVPAVPPVLANAHRQQDILAEIHQADPQLIVLLGDEPIKWFLATFDDRWHALKDFGQMEQSYGRVHRVTLAGRAYDILPLVHPRQAAKLGAHSSRWAQLHERWVDTEAHKVGL